MNFQFPHYEKFRDEFLTIARKFSLNPEHLTIEFYTPKIQAIMVEQVQDQRVKIHIDLEAGRIVSVQKMPESLNGNFEVLKEKYRKFMC